MAIQIVKAEYDNIIMGELDKYLKPNDVLTDAGKKFAKRIWKNYNSKRPSDVIAKIHDEFLYEIRGYNY